ncbi:MAG: hypothetical protein KGR19_07120 [Acidobacteria bacterium]|nr:hypothetical protein [Acidobacteriota bacterium]
MPAVYEVVVVASMVIGVVALALVAWVFVRAARRESARQREGQEAGTVRFSQTEVRVELEPDE